MNRTSLALVLSLLALFLVACGGSSEDDYASEVSDTVNALGTELQEAGEAATSATSEEEVVAALEDSEESLTGAVDDLEGIDPPEDVADLHDELIGLTEGYAETVAETRDAVESGAPASELSGFLTESQTFATDLTDLRDQFVEAGIEFGEEPE